VPINFSTRLQDCRAVVSGGAKGIGAAISRRLVDEGALVVICDIDEETGLELSREIGCSFAATDITDYDAVSDLYRNHGPFDIVVNNVGVDQHAYFTKTTPADWRRLLAINLESAFALTHVALPSMQSSRYGRIVNIASEAGRLGSSGGAIYSAAKGGVIAFTKSIARENARYGITANVVTPGPIATPLLMSAVEVGGDKLMDQMKAATLVGRLGEPEEVAAAVAFLASRESAFITGETLGVSGGMGIG